MQFVCKTSANDEGTELCVQVKKKKKRVSKPRRLTYFVSHSRGKVICEARFASWLHQCRSASRGSDLLQSESGRASPGVGAGKGLGRASMDGQGRENRLCFTDMNTKLELLSACPFISQAEQLADECGVGELVCKT